MSSVPENDTRTVLGGRHVVSVHSWKRTSSDAEESSAPDVDRIGTLKITDLSKNLVERGFPFASGKLLSGLTSGAGASILPAISKGPPSVALIVVAIGPPDGWS